MASYLGFWIFALVSAFGIGTGEVSFALVGIRVGFSLLFNHFDKKKDEKIGDKKVIKDCEGNWKSLIVKKEIFIIILWIVYLIIWTKK